MSTKFDKVLGRGFMRKQGKQLVSGIALAGLVTIAGGLASADEVSADVPTTGDVVATKDVAPVNAPDESVKVDVNPTYTTQVPVTSDLSTAVDKAKDTGVVVTETTSQAVATEQDGQSDYAKQATTVNQVTADYQKELDAYKKEEDAYKQEVAEFNQATNVSTEGTASTQDNNTEFGNTWQRAVVNADGSFSSTHDLVDGISSFAQGTLNGKINYTVANNGDGTETVTISSVDLNDYVMNVTGVNQAVNKNIEYIVKDINDNVLYSRAHDGMTSFTDVIGKSFALNQTVTLKVGESSDWIQFLKIDDTWIYNTYGQLYFKLTNTNVPPTAPTAPQAPTVAWHKNIYEVPMVAVKQVQDADGKDIDNGTVEIGDEVTYVLTGAYVENTLSDPLWQYGFEDYLAVEYDDYKGWDINIPENVDIKLADGTAVTKDLLKENVSVVYDADKGKWTLDVNKDFIDKLDKASAFQVQAVVKAIRIKAGQDIPNDSFNPVNGQVVYSNVVKTSTPEKSVEETPVVPVDPTQPVQPIAPTVVQQEAVLPSTGEADSNIAWVLGSMLILMGFFVYGRTEKES